MRYLLRSLLFLSLLLAMWGKVPTATSNVRAGFSRLPIQPATRTDLQIFLSRFHRNQMFRVPELHLHPPLDFKDPPLISEEVVYDPVTNQYTIYRKIGDINYRTPRTMTFEEYMDYRLENSLQNYWKERTAPAARRSEQDGIIPQIHVGGEVFERLFGSSTIDIRPQGSAELILGCGPTIAKIRLWM
jgi:hypothetical protein